MVTTEQLKQLREETGVSVMQCKKALEEAGGDMEKARIILKKKSGDAAAKKADRELGAGAIVTLEANGKVVMLSLLCETDFVAKNEDFINAANEIAGMASTSGADGLEDASKDMVAALIQKVGENVKLGDVIVTEATNTGFYNHNGQYAAVVSLKETNADLAKDIAMHATAMRPSYIKEEDIDETAKNNAKEIFAKEVEEQAAGKPEEMKAKILEGKIDSYFKDQVLMKQAFIKDPSKTIERLLKEANNETTFFKLSQI